ncbi:MAG TPA: Gfo/Idh/MocA family oxidoreductase [Terriglobia bacterium]|nr:Gfo/Idh/MocA family oxidoreductase [Terriglobia bacterium]
MSEDSGKKVGRREFMGTAAAAASFMIMAPQLVRGTEANSTLRVGLLGCGGRGTADAQYTIETGKARLVALADIFQDQLDKAKAHFDKFQQSKGYAAIDRKLMFKGPMAYQQIANSKDVDVVIITTPPFFHPQHLAEVVTAGKHVYCEKPVAVDPAGCISVLDSGRRAEGRLSLEVGFQLRNAPPYVEQVKRIHSGALGDIVSGAGHYFSGYIDRPSWPGASPDEHRLRNWVHYRTLSGDIIVEQNIHVIDVCNWVLQGHPIKASASGSKLHRPDPGDCYNNYSVVFEYPNRVSMTFGSTQFNKGWWDVGWQFFGTKGVSETHYNGPVAIYGENAWKYGEASSEAGGGKFSAAGVFHGNLDQADPEKKKSFVESILNNQFHNQAQQGVESALSCMMGRRAAYTGEEVSYEQMANSGEKWAVDIDLTQFA